MGDWDGFFEFSAAGQQQNAHEPKLRLNLLAVRRLCHSQSQNRAIIGRCRCRCRRRGVAGGSNIGARCFQTHTHCSLLTTPCSLLAAKWRIRRARSFLRKSQKLRDSRAEPKSLLLSSLKLMLSQHYFCCCCCCCRWSSSTTVCTARLRLSLSWALHSQPRIAPLGSSIELNRAFAE